MDDTNLDIHTVEGYPIENVTTEKRSEEELHVIVRHYDQAETRKRCCNACGGYYRMLGRHLLTHGPDNCTDCLLHFSSVEQLNEHMQEEHKIHERSYNCDVCKLGFLTVTHLALHNYKHTMKYTCPLCQFTAKGKHKMSLINHIRRHEGHFEVFCDLCGQGFLGKRELDCHMEIHEDIPKYPCEFCEKKFTVKKYLDVHKSFNHKKELFGVEESFQCEICGRNFSFNKSLVRHLSSIHHIGEDRRVDCPICKKKIANNHNLKKHMRMHTGEKRFCCDLCGKAFSEKKYLLKHQAAHRRADERKRKDEEEKASLSRARQRQDIVHMPPLFFYEDSDEDASLGFNY